MNNELTFRNYLAMVLDGMAKGLFASLIIGTIISQIGSLLGNIDNETVSRFALAIEQIGRAAQLMMGSAIGAGVAFRRGVKPFTLLAAVAAGALGAGTLNFADGGIAIASVGVGDPVGALLAVLAAIEIARLVEGKTKFDLLIIPAIVIAIGGAVGFIVTPIIAEGLARFGIFVNSITELHPIPMSILLATIIGITLTLPIISSAALCIAIGIGGDPAGILTYVTEYIRIEDGSYIPVEAATFTFGTIAAGAALAGACAQMVGFAVISFRENRVSGLISQGIGTSMIQMPNIIKNPWIWLPPIIASAIAGPIAAVLLSLRTTSVGAGMGTSGLVGPFQTIYVMGMSSFVQMLIAFVILPAVVSLVIAELMRKKGLIKPNDLKL